MSKTANAVLAPKICAKIDKWVAKFPAGRQQSAVLMALKIVQDANRGHLTEADLLAVARYLDMPKIAVTEVATFYNLYHLEPIGRYKISICKNISCMLRGADSVVRHLEKQLGIQLGETTRDGNFTLVAAECIASCCRAPALQINDKIYHENLSGKTIDQLLNNLE